MSISPGTLSYITLGAIGTIYAITNFISFNSAVEQLETINEEHHMYMNMDKFTEEKVMKTASMATNYYYMFLNLKAADMFHNPVAQYVASRCYNTSSLGCIENKELALHYLTESAKGGYVLAEADLGNKHLNEERTKEAVKLQKLATEGKLPTQFSRLESLKKIHEEYRMYINMDKFTEEEVMKTASMATNFYYMFLNLKAADMFHNPVAQYIASGCYDTSALGCIKNKELALHYLTESAEGGYVLAEADLGSKYLNEGRTEEAVKLLKLATEQKLPTPFLGDDLIVKYHYRAELNLKRALEKLGRKHEYCERAEKFVEQDDQRFGDYYKDLFADKGYCSDEIDLTGDTTTESIGA